MRIASSSRIRGGVPLAPAWSRNRPLQDGPRLPSTGTSNEPPPRLRHRRRLAVHRRRRCRAGVPRGRLQNPPPLRIRLRLLRPTAGRRRRRLPPPRPQLGAVARRRLDGRPRPAEHSAHAGGTGRACRVPRGHRVPVVPAERIGLFPGGPHSLGPALTPPPPRYTSRPCGGSWSTSSLRTPSPATACFLPSR